MRVLVRRGGTQRVPIPRRSYLFGFPSCAATREPAREEAFHTPLLPARTPEEVMSPLMALPPAHPCCATWLRSNSGPCRGDGLTPCPGGGAAHAGFWIRDFALSLGSGL